MPSLAAVRDGSRAAEGYPSGGYPQSCPLALTLLGPHPLRGAALPIGYLDCYPYLVRHAATSTINLVEREQSLLELLVADTPSVVGYQISILQEGIALL